MAVRFLPPPEDRSAATTADRGDLAEVIEFRSRLGGASPAGRSGEASEAEAEPADVGSSREAAAGAPSRRSNVVEAVFGGNPAHSQRRGGAGRADDSEATDIEASDGSGEPDGPTRTANEDAVRLLARRARSSGELRAELVALGHDPHEVDDVIDEFVRSLYLDDLGLARVVTEKLREGKRASRAQIRQKLRERKFEDEAIETALGELDDDEEFALLRRTALERARRLGGVDRQTAERRLLGFLARRGWSGEPAVRAVRDALDGTGARSAGSRPSGGRGSSVRFE